MIIFSTIIIGVCILLLLEVFFLIDSENEDFKLQSSSNTNNIEKRIERLESKYSNLKSKFVNINSYIVNKNKGVKNEN